MFPHLLQTEEDGRVFPVSNNSASIVDCLLHEAKNRGGTVYSPAVFYCNRNPFMFVILVEYKLDWFNQLKRIISFLYFFIFNVFFLCKNLNAILVIALLLPMKAILAVSYNCSILLCLGIRSLCAQGYFYISNCVKL